MVIGISEGVGGGFQKPKFLKKSVKLIWNFQRGEEFKPKNHPWGGMNIFWNNTIHCPETTGSPLLSACI